MKIISNWHKHLIVLILLAMFFRGGTIYAALYVALILHFALGWSIRSTARALKVHRNVSEYRLFPGEKADVELTVVNDRPIPLSWLHIIDDSHPSLQATPEARFVLSLRGRERRVLNYSIEAKKRGVFQLAGATIETGDPFGLHQFMFHKRVIEASPEIESVGEEEKKEIIVYPPVRPLGALGLASYFVVDGMGRTNRSMSDPLKLIGMREYVTGESLRHVHWKASAHVGDLQVKMFEGTHHMDISLLLDLRKEGYPSWNVEQLSELAIETAASVLFETNKRKGSFGLTIIGKVANEVHKEVVKLPRGRGGEKMARALEALARIDLTQKDAPINPIIAECARELRPESTFVIITPRSDDILKSVAEMVRTTYRTVVVIELIGATEKRTDASKVLPPGVKLAYVSYAGEISELGREIVG